MIRRCSGTSTVATRPVGLEAVAVALAVAAAVQTSWWLVQTGQWVAEPAQRKRPGEGLK